MKIEPKYIIRNNIAERYADVIRPRITIPLR